MAETSLALEIALKSPESNSFALANRSFVCFVLPSHRYRIFFNRDDEILSPTLSPGRAVRPSINAV